MATAGGFGAQLKIDISGTMTITVDVVEIPWPEISRLLPDATAHDSASGYREFIPSGKREAGEFTVRVQWDDLQATHAALLTAYGSTTPLGMQLLNVSSTDGLSFMGLVKTIGRVSLQDGVYEANITIQPTGPVMPDYVFLGARSLATWETAKEQAAASRAKIVVIGDSVGVGWNATARGTEGWVPLLRTSLQATYGNGGGASLSITDELGAYWMHDTTTWTRVGFANADGFGLYLFSAKGTVGDTISRSWSGRYLEIYYKASVSAGDTFTVVINGGAPQNVLGAADNEYHVATFDAGSDSTHTVLINGPTTGGKYAWICGAIPYKTLTGVSVINASYAGRNIGSYVNGAFGTALDMLVQIAPDLVIYSHTINDYNTQVALNDYSTRFATAISEAQTAGASVMLIVNNDIQASQAIPLTSYQQILWSKAHTGNLALLDFYQKWGSYAVANAAGLMGDATHPSTAGHADMHTLISEHLG